MKLFGNTSPDKRRNAPEEEPLPSIPAPEEMAEFELSGKDFEEKLKLLLDGEKLTSAEQLTAQPPTKMEQPVNTDYHIVHDPIRGTKVRYEDESEEDEEGGISGTLKGALLLLVSFIILVLVIFGVYLNLV